MGAPRGLELNILGRWTVKKLMVPRLASVIDQSELHYRSNDTLSQYTAGYQIVLDQNTELGKLGSVKYVLSRRKYRNKGGLFSNCENSNT